MLITVLIAAACAIVAYRRGRSWWARGLAGAGIDVVMAIILVIAARKLTIDFRFASRNNLGIVSAAVALLLAPIVALAVVSRLTRVSDRKPPRARAAGASR